MKRIYIISIPIILCFLVGFIGSRFQIDAIVNWYPTLDKPSLTPPNSVFPIAWSILYFCMGLSIGLIVCRKSDLKPYFVKLFLLQLLFNFTWSISFFYLQNPFLGLINILLLLLLIIIYILKSYPLFRISSLLFIPYAVWVGFATYLNLYIYLYN